MSLLGCGTSPRWEVDPAVVREVSTIGTVIARTTNELLYENGTQVSHVMILDVGESNLEDALIAVRDRLRRHGWVETDAGPNRLDMKSAERDEAQLRAGGPSLLPSFPTEKHAAIVKALKDTADGTYAYPMIELFESGS
jgi:hypothetical protein